MTERSSRMRKIDELLREVIADEVLDLKDPAVGFVTITGVSCSPDLRQATVFYSVLGSDEEKEATAAALDRAAPFLQGRVGAQVRIKYTPRLTFAVDPAIDQGLRVTQILTEIAAENEDEDEEEVP